MIQTADKKFRIILIGSSTGGLPVVEKILSGIDKDKYAVLIAQHMPEGYTGMWAERLNRTTPFNVKEGIDGEAINFGSAYVAPGNRHMYLNVDTHPKVGINSEGLVNRFRPSIDVLFGSALNFSPDRIIAVMLTGMCDDGVIPMVELKKKGFITIAQDKESSVVFGMNKEAIKRGGVEFVFSPDEMIEYLNRI